jgi:hypothetical protein
MRLEYELTNKKRTPASLDLLVAHECLPLLLDICDMDGLNTSLKVIPLVDGSAESKSTRKYVFSYGRKSMQASRSTPVWFRKSSVELTSVEKRVLSWVLVVMIG